MDWDWGELRISLGFIPIFKEFSLAKKTIYKTKQIESLKEDYGWVKDKVCEKAKGPQEVQMKEALETQIWRHCLGQDHRCMPACQGELPGFNLKGNRMILRLCGKWSGEGRCGWNFKLRLL